MEAPPSNLTLILLITANLIPIVNRVLGFFETRKQTKDISSATANESTVVLKGNATLAEIEKAKEELKAEIAAARAEFKTLARKPDPDPLYKPITKEK